MQVLAIAQGVTVQVVQAHTLPAALATGAPHTHHARCFFSRTRQTLSAVCICKPMSVQLYGLSAVTQAVGCAGARPACYGFETGWHPDGQHQVGNGGCSAHWGGRCVSVGCQAWAQFVQACVAPWCIPSGVAGADAAAGVAAIVLVGPTCRFASQHPRLMLAVDAQVSGVFA
jgi:hypothetical protein